MFKHSLPCPQIIADALGETLIFAVAVGSRVTCNPPPINTDEDWLLHVTTDVKDRLEAFGFTQDGQPEFYTGNDAGGFRSWRLGDLNVITTQDTEFFDRFVTATNLAKRFNLLDKGDRIALFQAVLYGVRWHNLESNHQPADIPIGQIA